MTHRLKFLPLGGLGEIGMNCLVMEHENRRVLIDCGVQFPDDMFPGVDLLIPDFSYLDRQKKEPIDVVITHGHDDHIGAIPFLAQKHNVRVYCTGFPQRLLEQKMREVPHLKNVTFHEVAPHKSFRVGPFNFHPIPIAHSIVESLAYVIETPVGNIIHTGDFKHEGEASPSEMQNAFSEIKSWGDKGIHLLLSDSTNAERQGHSLAEGDILGSFEHILAEQKGRIFIALFASNIRRVHNLINLAKKMNKKVAFMGRSMITYTQIAFDLSIMDVPQNTLLPSSDLHRYPDNEQVILLTGSQGEPRAALMRLSNQSHRQLRIKRGDLILMSSRLIPGNEKAIYGMIDGLYRQGAEVLYETFRNIHVSGHGFQEELLLMLKAARPKFFVPVHGGYRHLAKHASLAASTGIPERNIHIIENGQSLELTHERLSLGPTIELFDRVVIEMQVLEGHSGTFAEREQMALSGIVHAIFLRNKKSKKLVGHPIVQPYGLLLKDNTSKKEFIEKAMAVAHKSYGANTHRSQTDMKKVAQDIKQFFKRELHSKPALLPTVIEL